MRGEKFWNLGALASSYRADLSYKQGLRNPFQWMSFGGKSVYTWEPQSGGGGLGFRILGLGLIY